MAKQTWKPGNMLYPVPAVMVSCQREGGKPNIITVAWAGTICSDPAMLSISVRKNRYSYDIIKETKEFVVYDAMSYKNKPDLTSDMISNIRLIYEAFLLTNEEIDMDKVATQISITKTSNYQAVSTDIEAWYSNKTDEEIKTGLKTVFDAFKKEIPSCTVGNYGIPVSDLNVFRYNRTESEEEIIKLWKKKIIRFMTVYIT